MSALTQLMMDVEDADANGIDTISIEVEGVKRLSAQFDAKDARIAELTAEVARMKFGLERIEATFRDIRLTTERSCQIMADIARNALREGNT